MIKYLNTLKSTEFFRGLPDNVILCLVESKSCFLKSYSKGRTIYAYNNPINYGGIVLEGVVDVIHSSVHGHDTIVNRITAGRSFGLSFACTEEKNTLNDIRCVTASRILFVNVWMLLQEECIQENYYLILTQNIIRSLSRNNIRLNSKIQILGQKTLREKLMAYFEELSKECDSRTIVLPFNREELSCFLCSERSSVCRELSKLAEEMLIRIEGRRIELLT